MKLPARDTNLGRVLRAMNSAGPLTAGEVRKRAGLAPDTAITARIRDLRKLGCVVLSYCEPHPTDPHKRLWRYKIVAMPKWMRRELGREARQMGRAA